MYYVAIIHKDKDSDYGVSFPDFPGCITAGITIDEAKDMAIEVLKFHVEGMVEDGEDIPASSSLEAIMKNPDFQDGVAFLVSFTRPDKTVRVNITLQKSDLAKIDTAAKARGLSRSAYLAEKGAAR